MDSAKHGARDWAKRSSVAAIFDDKDQAEAAIRELGDKGFGKHEIGVAMRDRDELGKLRADIEETYVGTGATTGALTGGVLGGVAGLLVGLGLLALPGIGPVVAAGALASALGVAATTAAAGAGVGVIAGGMVGALIGLGIPQHEAEYFEAALREGEVLVTTSASGRASEAAEILEDNGGDTGASLYDEPMSRSA